jgi:hypothetical protein
LEFDGFATVAEIKMNPAEIFILVGNELKPKAAPASIQTYGLIQSKSGPGQAALREACKDLAWTVSPRPELHGITVPLTHTKTLVIDLQVERL